MIFDIEADGLLGQVTKIHCMSYNIDGVVRSTTDYDLMKKILLSRKVLIGHNIVCYDVPVLEKILGVKIKCKLIDTLALSWYLMPNRNIHGLDSFGKDYGIPKPKISDWENLTVEEYVHRCTEDVKINTALWKDLRTRLVSLYDQDMKECDRLIAYLTFKMDCLREQEQSRWKLDVARAERCLIALEKAQEEKVKEIRPFMPKVKKFKDVKKPDKPFKKDGTLSVAGAKWQTLCRERGIVGDHIESISVLASEEEGNPNAHQQVKDWLFNLGWQPQSFDYKKNDDGTERKVPQLRVEEDGNKVLCPSVLALAEKHPEVGLLEGLSIIQHRLSIFKGYVESHENGWLVASAGGFTNTLRLKHRKPLVNLPSVNKEWGEDVRGSLIAPDGYLLCGSDMVSLEDTTKRHYMFDYDPEYVEEMSKEGFDPHLDLAKHAGEVTQEEIDRYVAGTGNRDLKTIRKGFKAANYSCVYGVGKLKLSRSLNCSVSEAALLIDAYWQRNWAVKKLAEDTVVKRDKEGQMWLFNPVSKFWYSLRYEKDIFSTLNQGTGVYCFDSWIKEFRKVRSQLTGQFHDEIIACIKIGYEQKYEKILRDAIARVNSRLNLNIKLDIDVQFGKTYAEIH